jgi:hypothetical protein
MTLAEDEGRLPLTGRGLQFLDPDDVQKRNMLSVFKDAVAPPPYGQADAQLGGG